MTPHNTAPAPGQQQLFAAPATALPDHGPGCKPLIAHNHREPGEPRYVCVPGCPRQRALAELDAARAHHTNPQESTT
jgi:hypothetical protein